MTHEPMNIQKVYEKYANNVINLQIWEAEALDEINLIRYHQMAQTWCERIIILCAEVREFKYAVKSWKLNEEIDSDTIKDLKELIARKDEALFHLGSKGSWVEGECFTNDIRFQSRSVIEIADDALALSSSEVKQGTSVCRHGVETDAKCIICWDKK